MKSFSNNIVSSEEYTKLTKEVTYLKQLVIVGLVLNVVVFASVLALVGLLFGQ